jgi:DNA-binding MurR/RpiR family transcriptional regulator
MEDYLTLEEAYRLIAEYITDNPSATYQDVGTRFGYSQASISVIAHKLGLPSRAAGKRKSRVQAQAAQAGCHE